MKRKLDKETPDQMSKNPTNWRGPFYFNPNDPRLVVPKWNQSMGKTFNFASPYAYITIILILLIMIVAGFLK